MLKNYIYPRYGKDILIYSFLPLIVVILLTTRLQITVAVLVAIVVNFLMYAFAFVYNDIEDRVEDAASPGKRFKNPFGYGTLSLAQGYIIMAALAAVSILGSYMVGGLTLTMIAVSNLVFGLLYSSKLIQLKFYPLVDLLSHSYLLATAQALYFIMLPQAATTAWGLLGLLGVTLVSMAGDLQNEARDFEDDSAAGLKNTASLLGKQLTTQLSVIMRVGAGIICVVAIVGAWVS